MSLSSQGKLSCAWLTISRLQALLVCLSKVNFQGTNVSQTKFFNCSTNANANTKDPSNNHRTRVQRGTISLKKRAWDRCNHLFYISDEEEYLDDKEDLVCRLFSTEENVSNDSRDLCNDITIHTGTIHSLKVYS